MRSELKILAIWVFLLISLRLSLLLPHRDVDPTGLINTALQILLVVLSLLIARHTTQRDEKCIFINFTLFFGFVFLLITSVFVGTSIFRDERGVSSFYYYFYINEVGLDFTLLFTVLYLVADFALGTRRILQKYAVGIGITATVIVLFFHSFLLDPSQLENEPEFVELQEISQAHDALIARSSEEPADRDLARQVVSTMNKGGGANHAFSTEGEALRMVQGLRPFLKEGGETLIFWKPLHRISMYVNGIVVFVIALFLGFNYRSNKPYHAYLDKTIILLGVFSFLEIAHTYGYSHSTSTENFRVVFEIGQYFTILCLIVMVYTFDRKLHFVRSSTGRYYETMLATSPRGVTRWRDELDNLILKAFSNDRRFLRQIGQFTQIKNEKQSEQE